MVVSGIRFRAYGRRRAMPLSSKCLLSVMEEKICLSTNFRLRPLLWQLKLGWRNCEARKMDGECTFRISPSNLVIIIAIIICCVIVTSIVVDTCKSVSPMLFRSENTHCDRVRLLTSNTWHWGHGRNPSRH